MNTLHVIREPDHTRRRHGGGQTVRTFAIYINEVQVRRYTEDTVSAWNYASGRTFDACLNAEVRTYEKALRCAAIRGKAK